MTEPLDIETSARLSGAYCWVERRLFEILGRWSGAVPEPEVKALLAAQSFHHAGHADLWEGCLPSLPHLDSGGLTAAPSPGLAALVDEVADPGDGQGTAGKLVGVYRLVVPRLRVAYARRRRAASPVADGPVLRTLDLVEADLARDGAAGEEALQGLLAAEAEARAAGERLGRLEARLIAAGGIP